MNKENEQKIIFTIVAVVCIIVFAFGISPKTLQNDTYYTIAIGNYIYDNGISDLTQDVFSWHNIPYTYPHWLYDLGIYIIFNSFGHAGIYASTIILTSILGLIIYMLCKKTSKNEPVSAIITILAMWILKPYIAARAQLFTFILFALTVYFIEMYLRNHKKRYLVYLLIIPLVIANAHCAVFLFYFVLYLPYIVEFLIEVLIDLDLAQRLLKLILKLILKLVKKDNIKEKIQAKIDKIPEKIEKNRITREKIRSNPYKIRVTKNYWVIPIIIVMLLSVFTGLINPAGNGAYTYLYKTMQGNTTDSINEHQPLVLISSEEFMAAIVLFLAILIFTDTKIELSDLFMLVGLTALAFKTKRQISMFAIFCAPIMAKLISSMFDKYDKKAYGKMIGFAGSILGSCTIILAMTLISIDSLEETVKSEYVDSNSYPVAACDWMIANLDVKNIKLYNEYNYGSYLLYRGIPVFVDSRADLYAPEFNGRKDIFSDALNIAGIALNYKTAFEDYGVTHAITYANAKLAMLLEDDSNYKKIYDDNSFKIFEKVTQEEEI